jgi:hypothetical protein
LAYDYAKEKFWQAVHELATSDRSIQERLADAAMYLSRLHRPEYLPEELREKFNALMDDLTQETATGSEDTMEATTRKLSADEGTALAQRILSLYTELEDGI